MHVFASYGGEFLVMLMGMTIVTGCIDCDFLESLVVSNIIYQAILMRWGLPVSSPKTLAQGDKKASSSCCQADLASEPLLANFPASAGSWDLSDRVRICLALTTVPKPHSFGALGHAILDSSWRQSSTNVLNALFRSGNFVFLLSVK